MHNTIHRDEKYTAALLDHIRAEYGIDAVVIMPAARGYYGETWKLTAACGSYFVKLDYFPRHQHLFRNSLPVVQHLCDSGIDFIPVGVKTRGEKLFSCFNSAVLGVFEWLDGENLETDDTKAAEYKMVCKIYTHTKQGFDIPTIHFSDEMAARFFGLLERLKAKPPTKEVEMVKKLLETHDMELARRARRLSRFAALCQGDDSNFFITHGDAGGNFFVAKLMGKSYLVDWDEVMYAPPERDAWVMCCHSWARELFNKTLKANGILYKLCSKRLAFYIYHMYFLYLSEFLDDFLQFGITDSIEEYFGAGYFMEERIRFADGVGGEDE